MKLVRCKLALLLLAALTLSACRPGSGEPTQPTQPKNPVIMPREEYEETPQVDYSLPEMPEFVENLSQCVDREKQYVLPNGYIYEYAQTFVPSAANRLHMAQDENGELFCGFGYQDNARIRSVLQIGESEGSCVTGFIPVRQGDVLYFSGKGLHGQYENAHLLHIVLYDADKNVLIEGSMDNAVGTFLDVLETDEQGYVTAAWISHFYAPWNVAYVRFSLIGSGAQQYISVNEPLDKGQETFAWVPAEQYIPAGWCQEIADTVETVNSIELADPAGAIRFVFATDIHVDPDPTGSYTGNMGKVSAEVMRACAIPFFATGGDNCTQSTGFMPEDFTENMRVLLEQLAPIPQKNILLSVGNHDGATGSREVNGETLYYRYQLNNQQRSAVFFDWQRESNPYKHFDSDGTYYYLDDSATKTRYIILNSFWSRWEGEENGYVTDPQHSFFHNHMFGPQQLKWFASEALDMPPEYGAVIITHFAPDAKDFEVFKGIVDAYSTHSTYQGSYIGQEDWQTTEISVNYKYVEGEIVAVFQGHNHEDAEHDFFQTVPCINVTTAGAHWAVKDVPDPKRTRGTATEFAADVVVIDRENRVIYLTRLGVGEDRVIAY